MEAIIATCISSGITLFICLINNHTQQERTRTLIEYKLEELTKRVDKHNQVIERTYNLEQRMCTTEEQIKMINYKIKN